MKKTILLGIIVAIILVISGYFLYTQNQNPKREIDVSKTNIDTPEKQKPKPIAEKPPEGWKEYVDGEYKFRLWYPEEFTYKNKTDQTKIEKFNDSKEKGLIFYVNVLTDAPLILTDIYIIAILV